MKAYVNGIYYTELPPNLAALLEKYASEGDIHAEE